ncbi:ANTAR domain-containing protein [Cellulomonas triticagri]|uniref:ANTAR domain-containing protein n=1 Tax=Cellulomonas triticagri TaxID=2483352 RepID=UPI0013159B33|nr:ANTAR domain-containing protein [Cellulomonas triticagri]
MTDPGDPGATGADLWRADALGELHGMLAATVQVDALLQVIVLRAAAVAGPDVSAAITVRQGGRSAVAAASDAAAAACDHAEQAAQAGPCLEAARIERLITVPDVAADDRWPVWRDATLAVGFGTAAAVPARSVEGNPDLAINLYRPGTGEWQADALAGVQRFAEDAARAVAVAAHVEAQTQVNTDLKRAMASRTVIDQALGVIMAQNRCGPEEAFRILRSASQHRNQKMRDVAADLVAGVSGSAPHAVQEFRERR